MTSAPRESSSIRTGAVAPSSGLRVVTSQEGLEALDLARHEAPSVHRAGGGT